MALPPSKVFRQDMPPPGGFPKPAGFPVAGYRKRSPARGPSGLFLGAVTLGIMIYGWRKLLKGNEERNYQNLSRWNARFERGYVLQAIEDAAWQRRQKEMVDAERELMKDTPGWVVQKSRYWTQAEEKPDVNALDVRRPGPWGA